MPKTKKSAAGKPADSGAEPVSGAPASAGAMDEAVPEPSFEGALLQLEQTVGRLEQGEMPLEEALALFEQGVKLSRQCTATLEAAEKRVEILVAGRGEDWLAAPFETEDDETDLEQDEDFD